MSSSSSTEQEPLLSRTSSSAALSYDSHSTTKSLNALESNNDLLLQRSRASDRNVENDVLPETTALGRNLGWSSAYILIVSRVIGSGIFATPGAITKSVGSVGLSLVLWVVGGLIAWFGLQISLEYGSMLPRSGGDKVYLEYTYRRPRFLASTLIAVQSVLLGFTASNCIVFAEYTLFAFDKEPTDFARKTIAAGLLTAIIVVHGCFRRAGIFIQNVLGWIKIALILFMVVTSIFVVLFRSRERESSFSKSINPIATTDYFWHGSVWEWGTIATALFKVFYSYAGLQNVNNVMNELKDPVRTLKSAANTALLTAAVLYLLVNIAYFLIVPMQDIKHSGELVAALFFERVFGQSLGRTILPLAIAISAVGNVMVVTFTHARVNQEIARQGFLPFARLLSSSKPFTSPLGGLLVHYVPSLLVILLPTRRDIYSFILEVEGFPAQFFALATSLGLIWLRRTQPALHRPYRAWLGAVWLRVLMSVALIAAPLVPRRGVGWREHLGDVSYAFVGLALFAFGTLYWYIWTVGLPRWGGYELVEAVETLDDGTTITRLVRIYPPPQNTTGLDDEPSGING